jgi:hypothetical protein
MTKRVFGFGELFRELVKLGLQSLPLVGIDLLDVRAGFPPGMHDLWNVLVSVRNRVVDFFDNVLNVGRMNRPGDPETF